MKLCSVDGCTNTVFGKHFCKFHYPKSLNKKPLPKSKGFQFSNSKEVCEYIERRNQFFKTIWKKRQHFSEVSYTFLGNIMNSMFFHHILPKRNHKEAEFDEENIILLTPEEHANVESNIFKYDEVNKRRELLKKKYNIM